MIIDIHGHYTTAPKALEEWRNRQIAAIGGGEMPTRAELRITDDELRERTARHRDRPGLGFDRVRVRHRAPSAGSWPIVSAR